MIDVVKLFFELVSTSQTRDEPTDSLHTSEHCTRNKFTAHSAQGVGEPIKSIISIFRATAINHKTRHFIAPSDLLVCGDVEEEVLVLGRGVLGAVWAGIAHDHHDGRVGVLGLGLAEELEARVGDQVGEVVLGVVIVVADLKKKKK